MWAACARLLAVTSRSSPQVSMKKLASTNPPFVHDAKDIILSWVTWSLAVFCLTPKASCHPHMHVYKVLDMHSKPVLPATIVCAVHILLNSLCVQDNWLVFALCLQTPAFKAFEDRAGDWFCSEDCSSIWQALNGRVSAGPTPLDPPDYTLQLMRGRDTSGSPAADATNAAIDTAQQVCHAHASLSHLMSIPGVRFASNKYCCQGA